MQARAGRRGHWVGLVVLVSPLFHAACGSESSDAPGAPAGERTFPANTAVDTLVADLTIGSETGRAEEAFGNIRDVEVGPDGTIYVLDGSANAVRVFGPGGKFLHSIGRPGEGPGEFRRPQQMTLAPDGTLWVLDEGLRVVLLLSPDGTELARHASQTSGPRGGPLSFLWDGSFGRDGRFVQTVQHSDPLPSGAMGVFETRNRLFLRSLDPSTGAVDSVNLSEDPLRRYRIREQGPGDGGGVLLGVVPFDPRRLAAFDRDGNVWTALSTTYVLERRTPTGDTLIVRRDVEETPLGPEERAAWERMDEERRWGIELPARGHVLWRLFTDDEDRLWAQRAEGFAADGFFDVFRQNGEPLGTVSLPGRLNPYATVVRGGKLYAVTLDELGVSRVIRAPIPPFR